MVIIVLYTHHALRFRRITIYCLLSFRVKLEAGESHTYRFRVPKGKTVVINDVVRGHVAWDAETAVGDFILLRSTG